MSLSSSLSNVQNKVNLVVDTFYRGCGMRGNTVILLHPFQSFYNRMRKQKRRKSSFSRQLLKLLNHKTSEERLRAELHKAIEAKDLAALNKALAVGADPNGADPNEYIDQHFQPIGLPLHHAIRLGFWEGVDALLSCSETDPNREDNVLGTPLIYGLGLKDKEAVLESFHKLLPYVNINQPSTFMRTTPIHRALTPRHGDETIAKTILSEILAVPAINLEILDAQGRTPLHLAAFMDNLTAVEKLVSHHANLYAKTPPDFFIEKYALKYPIALSRDKKIQSLLLFAMKGSHWNGLSTFFSAPSQNIFTEVDHSQTHLPRIKTMSSTNNKEDNAAIKQDISKNSPTAALFDAVYKSDFDKAYAALYFGADINAKRHCLGVVTALSTSISEWNNPMMMSRLLLEYPNMHVEEDFPMLIEVMRSSNCVRVGEVLSLLTQYGADINSTDENGYGALYYAIQYRSRTSSAPELVRAVLSQPDINPDLLDNAGRPPLYHAMVFPEAGGFSSNIKSLFEEAGANLDLVVDRQGKKMFPMSERKRAEDAGNPLWYFLSPYAF